MFEPEEICISEEISDKAHNSGVSLTQTLDNSLPTYQIKRKRVSDLVNGTKQKLKKKNWKSSRAVKEKIIAIVSGQSSEFIDVVLDSKKEENKEKYKIPEELIKVKKPYEESGNAW